MRFEPFGGVFASLAAGVAMERRQHPLTHTRVRVTKLYAAAKEHVDIAQRLLLLGETGAKRHTETAIVALRKALEDLPDEKKG